MSNIFMEKLEGYVRYKGKKDSVWTGRISKDYLTTEMIQVMRFEGNIFEEDFSYIHDLEIPPPPKTRSLRRLKKSELEQDVNYILCPDKKCGLFWDPRFRMACESYCPQKEKMEKMVACGNCGEPIYLGSEHSTLQTVHHLCKDGRNSINFTRMRGNYKIIYKRPKD